jgi:hypothetical protein
VHVPIFLRNPGSTQAKMPGKKDSSHFLQSARIVLSPAARVTEQLAQPKWLRRDESGILSARARCAPLPPRPQAMPLSLGIPSRMCRCADLQMCADDDCVSE